jgi:hypothetical protein
MDYLVRHIAGEWGDVDEHDYRENELSLIHGFRLLSAYTHASPPLCSHGRGSSPTVLRPSPADAVFRCYPPHRALKHSSQGNAEEIAVARLTVKCISPVVHAGHDVIVHHSCSGERDHVAFGGYARRR